MVSTTTISGTTSPQSTRAASPASPESSFPSTPLTSSPRRPRPAPKADAIPVAPSTSLSAPAPINSTAPSTTSTATKLFGAKSPFSDTKQKVRNYNTGFSVGGPFLKDKLFGFLTFEHQRFVIGQSGTATEPSVGWQNQAKAILAATTHPRQPGHAGRTQRTSGAPAFSPQDTVGVPNNYHSSDPGVRLQLERPRQS